MESHHVKKKRICIITTNRSDYGRLKPVMEEILAHPSLELKVVVGTPLFFDHLLWYFKHGEPLSFWKSLPWYLSARGKTFFGSKDEILNLDHMTRLLRQDGFPVDARIPMVLEGGNLRVMTKTSGLCMLGLPGILEQMKPDVVVINGDRFEMLPIAFSVVCSNIILAHIEGGDISGTIDESVRHAITKLAHIHFPATEQSAYRIRMMGENPDHIFVTGSPVIDMVAKLDLSLDHSVYERHPGGGGERVDFTKPFLLVIHHPVTTRYEKNFRETEELIAALDALPIQKFFLASNLDGGSDGVSAAFRAYRGRNPPRSAFFKHLMPDDFYRVCAHAAVMVGNSSGLIREGSFLGTPAVLVGDRQQGRERGENVMEVGADRDEITAAVKKQIAHGRYPRTTLFGDGGAGKRIAELLATIQPQIQKAFHPPTQEAMGISPWRK